MGNNLAIAMTNAPGGRWADYSILGSLKVAAVGVDGHYVAEPKTVDLGSTLRGTTIGNPAQMSTCVSLRASSTLGTGNRGRMYLPHFYMSQLTNSPFADASQSQTLADLMATFLMTTYADVNEDTTATVQPVIMSQATPGSSKIVTSVRVGNVNDTQRRRRNQLVETYKTAITAISP